MARFSKTVDIWNLSPEAIAKLQPGQWVKAGPDGTKGRFMGQGASTVVAWVGRIPRGNRYFPYLRAYAAIGREVRAKAVTA
ncbi:hypothetical protein DSM25558_5116 [Agrobacterium sp. DSM 25558]|uniref:hypothetical protein n=1 Tax=Agrobacterium sp. DSM 25558 TaxID=1907665 RepID=UPI0009724F5D|nr:hypothetical protein [Agrobacterium sp. DSM 25558]SCX31089.1 hypothetical protein DSM25558_5116 [Agrobacterium sp. DSM 25558]